MTAPLVSICFSTFNHVHFLRQSIPSILAQTETDWELLIWDDGCDDDTCSYVESLADPRVHILHGTRSHGDPLVLNRAYF
ncbi:MAG: glycosyltransferase, partial [Candidatus Sericytochromatia bacterium]|nr:glycosyltransferase [Candidatus Sericytochromatia bacterium]